MSQAEPVRVGVMGCGAISAVYLRNLARLPEVEAVACADVDADRARNRAQEFDIRACTPDELLALDEVEVVLNLTVPMAHADVSLAALNAGKHVYSEKPLAVTREDGRRILATAGERGLRVGCAPDTVLGGAIQTSRRLVDLGAIGRPVAATASFMSHGMEWWHPNPQFFFQAGAGPLMDLGPYSLTTLVNLVGCVRRVATAAQISFPQRIITSQPLHGTTIDVEVPTHVAGVLELEPGAIASYQSSWEVWHHNVPCLEIYGTEGSLVVGDPNYFLQTPPRLRRRGWKEWIDVESDSPFRDENWRGVGVADMARALRTGGDFRVTGEMGYHVLDVMLSMAEAAEERRTVDVQSTVTRPEPTRIVITLPNTIPGGENDPWPETVRETQQVG